MLGFGCEQPLNRILGALVATNQPAAVSNLLLQSTGVSVTVPNPNDPVEKEYQKLLEADDDAQAEVDKWIQDNNDFSAKGAGVEPAELNRRIMARFAPVRKGYEDLSSNIPIMPGSSGLRKFSRGFAR